ncbi:MAG: hypothetical protein U0R66_02065 [Mycobacterium sp.]
MTEAPAPAVADEVAPVEVSAPAADEPAVAEVEAPERQAVSARVAATVEKAVVDDGGKAGSGCRGHHGEARGNDAD